MEAFIVEIAEKQTSVGTMYDLVLSNGEKLGMGKFPPKGFKAGDYIQCEVAMRGQYKNLAPGSLKKQLPPQGIEAPAAPAPGKSSGGGGSFDTRQETISRQSALNSALAFVNLLVTADALPVPKSAKSDKKADLMYDIVRHYTMEYYKQSTGNEMEIEGIDDGLAGDLAKMEADDGEWA